ncbi:antibiotic biosynthesis monooxygenase family protein [Pseudooceanicola spongiae]|uniref:Antibiotic biosynthesis monooxygenase n=1 Tax=Pseudooceanicola spongiae TaxID=2613965 RepID=A0A7L9WKG3_9RHOB|nr:antibiotic biosynthesis monooxygenase family protein [Pseudooceanicola spongiae]QOL80324.1 antibiotic biosynthesis monooxygenase [Pseudooceanicola spongiae]
MADALYRIDKFIVPEAARDRFLDQVAQVHAVLRHCPGCLSEQVVEQCDGPGRFNIVTIAVWESAEAIEAAKRAVLASRGESGIDPASLIAELGITADMAVYREI